MRFNLTRFLVLLSASVLFMGALLFSTAHADCTGDPHDCAPVDPPAAACVTPTQLVQILAAFPFANTSEVADLAQLIQTTCAQACPAPAAVRFPDYRRCYQHLDGTVTCPDPRTPHRIFVPETK